MPAVVAAIQSGHIRTAAKLLRALDDDAPGAHAAAAQLAESATRAHVIGITGPAGAGKSTLVSALVTAIRATGSSVAVLAVDPSSTRTGGALLGDRVRMVEHAEDPGVFIRSVGSRGALGGLGRCTVAMVTVMEAMGFDRVIVETVGVGQSEVDIARLADTTVVVALPGAGDDVQAMKAGLLEEGDIFAVNKADMPGARLTASQLRAALRLTHRDDGWHRPVLQMTATTGQGVDRLLAAVDKHAKAAGAPTVRPDRVAALVLEKAHRWCDTALADELAADGANALRTAFMSGERTIGDILRTVLDADAST